MPAPPPPLEKVAAERLVTLGARLRAHRKALHVSATTTAEAAGISRVTLHRIEHGEASVTMGAYVAVIAALGLDLAIVDANARAAAARPPKPLPRRIKLADYAQLRRLAWQRADAGKESVTPKEALALYERNWRHVDRAAMDDVERELVQRLVDTVGGGRLLV